MTNCDPDNWILCKWFYYNIRSLGVCQNLYHGGYSCEKMFNFSVMPFYVPNKCVDSDKLSDL